MIDSGASNNFVKHELMGKMRNVIKLDQEVNIHIADGKILKSTMKGELFARCQGMDLVIEALIVPSLRQNLLSVSKMASRGLDIVFRDTVAEIRSGKSVLSCKRVNGVYILKVDEFSEQCHTAFERDELWHRRLGHINGDFLLQLGLP